MPVTLEEFLEQADAWLAERYPKAARDRRFVWGEGDDEVRVFQEPDPELEAGALPAIRRWRQELWDHGYGWISGPPLFGGQQIACQLFSEPRAGSDLAAVRTQAVRDTQQVMSAQARAGEPPGP